MANEQVIAKFERGILAGSNKAGIIKPNEKGYFPLTLGAFEATNESGIFYPMTPTVESCMKESSPFMRRTHSGNLRGELEHPRFEPGMSMPAYLNRLRFIDIRNECCHFGGIQLTRAKDHTGASVIRVDGLVKPSGVHLLALERALQNTEEDVCFSVRSIVKQVYEGGRYVNYIQELVTWDRVNEPGIRIARKYMSPGLESFMDDDGSMIITPDILDAAERDSTFAKAAGLEGVGEAISTTMIRTALGWQKVQKIKMGAFGW